MDEYTVLLLSRYVDGDLGPSETHDLKESLRHDPQLANDLTALENLRASVAALAERDEPPAELDRLMEPLRRGTPERPNIRPWLRWTGMAAAAVLALTVIIEVNRHTPGPELDQQPRATHHTSLAKPTERFALAPLPTASTPEEEQPLGVADRLLASPIPEREVTVEPQPLEVLGPLNKEETKALATNDAVKIRPEGQDSGAASDETGLLGSMADAGRSPGSAPASPVTPTEMEPPGAQRKAEKRSEAAAIGEMAPMAFESGGTGRLFVAVNGETIWRSFDPKRRCSPGRYIVRVEIVSGAVVRALPFGAVQSLAPAETCAADLVCGLEIKGVPDGEFRAEIVIEAIAPK